MTTCATLRVVFTPTRASGTRSFLDNITIAPSVAPPSGTSPWVAVAAIAAGLTGLVALARYYDDRKAK